jgi:hypothetical protein
MSDLILRRVEQARQTLGLLSVYEAGEKVYSCATLELPWQDNENRKSCIPPAPAETAEYKWQRHQSQRYDDCIWVRGVDSRSEILIHAGNFVSDTLGCILVGEKIRDINHDSLSDVTNSQATLAELLSRVGNKGTLQVGWVEQPEPQPVHELRDAA